MSTIRIEVKFEGELEVRGLISKQSQKPGVWISYMGGQRYCGNGEMLVRPMQTLHPKKVICSGEFMGDNLRLVELLSIEGGDASPVGKPTSPGGTRS